MGSPSQGPPTALSFPPERSRLTARPHLLVLAGPELGTSVELGSEPLEIGRDPSCGLVLTSDGVSRKHARVQLIFSLYFVSDLGSTNGTFVNEQRVSMAQLDDGAQLRIGASVLKFTASQLELQYSQQLHGQASTDPLTGLANRARFEADSTASHDRCTRSGDALSLVLIDVDHFKRINDSLGHAAGDAALALVARTLERALPSGASLYRVGGEEFAVLLPGALRAAALEVAERLRAAVAVAPLEHAGAQLPITVSLGVAQLGDAETPARLYERADQLLYKSKLQGRNRVS